MLTCASQSVDVVATRSGLRITQIVETLDLFPTIVELAFNVAAGGAADDAHDDGSAGRAPHAAAVISTAATPTAIPPCPQGLNASRATMLCTDGASLAPLLLQRTPAVANAAPYHDNVAYSQVPRGAAARGMPGGKQVGMVLESYMGYTLRTTGWRYTEWHHFDRTLGVVRNWSDTVAFELYRHDNSTSSNNCTWDVEHANVAGASEFALAQEELAALLCKGNPTSCTPLSVVQ